MVRKLPNIEVRDAKESDLDVIMALANEFFTYGGLFHEHYDEEIFRITAETSFKIPDIQHTFLAYHDEKLVGYLCVSVARTYTTRPMMFEAHLVVLREYSRSHAGRMLTQAAIDYGEGKRALAYFAGSTSGIKSFDKSIINMYTKFDFVRCGEMMKYEYKD